jgi:hypothetical protein
MLQRKFIIQRSFFEDSTKGVSDRAVKEFNNYSQNVIDTIPFPSAKEFELFQCFGIVDNNDDLNVVDTDI